MSKFICSLPWNHISVNPHGWSSVCCEANWDSEQSTARNKGEDPVHISEGIEKVINSDTFKDIRKEMLAGEVPDACMSCYKIEQVGGHSKRLRSQIPPKNLSSITKDDGYINPALSNIELRLGNFCNLKCRSCNAESSTSWIDDYNKLKDKIEMPSSYDHILSRGIDYDWVEDPDIYLDLLKNIYNPEVLHISGGEPFLVDKHSYLLDLLIEKDLAKDMTVAYVTNASYNFDKITPILDKLINFKQVVINFSLDDINERNDYIRKLSKFEIVIDNIKKFTSKYKFIFNITQTIHIFNFLYLEELHILLEKEGLYKKDGTGIIGWINDNFVVYPDYHNVNTLPLNIRREKIDKLEGVVNQSFFERVKKTFYNSPYNNLRDKFIKTTTEVDKVRREDFKTVFPYLKEIIENELP